MKWQTTAWLLVAVAGVGAALWLAEREPEDRPGAVAVGAPLCGWALEDVSRLEFASNAVTVVLVRRDGQWFLDAPLRARADEGLVERMIAGFEGLTRREVVTAAERAQRGLSLRDYGLAPPLSRWRVSVGEETHTLDVGVRAPLGAQVYVRMDEGSEVIATEAALAGLVPPAVDKLRDARILAGAEPRVTRIELHRPAQGFIRLTRTDGLWQIQQPVEAPADAVRVRELLDQLFALQAVSYVWDPGAPASNAVAAVDTFGLADDEAAARLQVWLDGDLVSYALVVGNPAATNDTLRYAQRRDVESIYTIRTADLGWLRATVDDLRARDLFRLSPAEVRGVRLSGDGHTVVLGRDGAARWQLLDPVQWRADQQAVDDLLAGLTRWRASGFVEGQEAARAQAVISNAWCDIVLSSNAPVAGAGAHLPPVPGGAAAGPVAAASPGAAPLAGAWAGAGARLRVGTNAADGTVYAQFDGDATLYRLSSGALKVFGTRPFDPLQYRDRTILAVEAGDVQRVALERRGRLQAIARNAAGRWDVEDGTNGVAAAAVDDLLLLVGNLRALRAEAAAPEDLSTFGLAAPVASLTVGLTGASGIQKTLVLGGAVPQVEGVYAMIKGQDVIYVLPGATADLLMRDIIK